MSEDLSDYLQDNGIKVRYLHSDIETVERTEIIRDLRLGVFDVLVGVNLLREGLDMPEVSLVAIFDADKEGFLRSEGALIQTMGRAARNVNGKVILYGDKVTNSMKRAIDETERRRQRQAIFNIKNNIKPRSIVKGVQDIMEGARTSVASNSKRGKTKVTNSLVNTSPDNLSKAVNDLEKKMYDHARNLEFEKAAKIRDKITLLNRNALGINVPG